MKSMKLSKIAAFAAFLGFSAAVAASGGPSGPAVTYPVQGHIGEVIVNPYNVATAVISSMTSPSKFFRNPTAARSNTKSPNASLKRMRAFRCSVCIRTTSTRWK